MIKKVLIPFAVLLSVLTSQIILNRFDRELLKNSFMGNPDLKECQRVQVEFYFKDRTEAKTVFETVEEEIGNTIELFYEVKSDGSSDGKSYYAYLLGNTESLNRFFPIVSDNPIDFSSFDAQGYYSADRTDPQASGYMVFIENRTDEIRPLNRVFEDYDNVSGPFMFVLTSGAEWDGVLQRIQNAVPDIQFQVYEMVANESTDETVWQEEIGLIVLSGIFFILLAFLTFYRHSKEISVRKLQGNGSLNIAWKLYGKGLLLLLIIYALVMILFIASKKLVFHPVLEKLFYQCALSGLFFCMMIALLFIHLFLLIYFHPIHPNQAGLRKSKVIFNGLFVFILLFSFLYAKQIEDIQYVERNIKSYLFLNSRLPQYENTSVVGGFPESAKHEYYEFQEVYDELQGKMLETDAGGYTVLAMAPELLTSPRELQRAKIVKINSAMFETLNLHDSEGNKIVIDETKDLMIVPTSDSSTLNYQQFCERECDVIYTQDRYTLDYISLTGLTQSRALKNPVLMVQTNENAYSQTWAVKNTVIHASRDEVVQILKKYDRHEDIAIEDYGQNIKAFMKRIRFSMIRLGATLALYVLMLAVSVYEYLQLFSIIYEKENAVKRLCGFSKWRIYKTVITNLIFVVFPAIAYLYTINGSSLKDTGAYFMTAGCCFLIPTLFHFHQEKKKQIARQLKSKY